MARLPEDLWSEILKRADVGALVQCRGVCKSWRCVISSPDFIRSHFSLNKNNGNRSYFLFGERCYAFYDPPQDDQSTLRFDSLRFAPLPFLPKPPCHPLHQPEYNVIDVIHGVVCLSQQSPYFSERFLLWNPAIHKYVEIPASFHGQIMPEAGFGFDAIKKDFKLVRIRCRYFPPDCIIRAPASVLEACRRHPPAIEVFSALEGRRRRLVADHIGPFSLLTGDHSCFLKGAIHWMLQSYAPGEKRELLVFDCEREEFRTMELPPEFNQGRIHRAKLFVTALGKLAVCWGFFGYLDKGKRGWVMDEYGVASSWKKLTCDQISDLVDLEPGSPYLPPAHDHIKRSHRPLNGHVFEPSMFLMDAKSLLL